MGWESVTYVTRVDDQALARLTEAAKDTVFRWSLAEVWLRSLVSKDCPSGREPECVWCLGPTKRNRCAKCKLVYYCSTSCQREHWLQGHKRECGTRTQLWSVDFEALPNDAFPTWLLREAKYLLPAWVVVRSGGQRLVLREPVFKPNVNAPPPAPNPVWDLVERCPFATPTSSGSGLLKCESCTFELHTRILEFLPPASTMALSLTCRQLHCAAHLLLRREEAALAVEIPAWFPPRSAGDSIQRAHRFQYRVNMRKRSMCIGSPELAHALSAECEFDRQCRVREGNLDEVRDDILATTIGTKYETSDVFSDFLRSFPATVTLTDVPHRSSPDDPSFLNFSFVPGNSVPELAALAPLGGARGSEGEAIQQLRRVLERAVQEGQNIFVMQVCG